MTYLAVPDGQTEYRLPTETLDNGLPLPTDTWIKEVPLSTFPQARRRADTEEMKIIMA